jgi:hypothetical protein
LRTYYAIYVYYFTYDVAWYAYYGWVWTALEAQLAVICASAPALKIFFNRYFSFITTTTSGLSKSKKASGYGFGTLGQSLGNSLKPSRTGSALDSKWEAEPVPLDRIQVSTGMDVVIEDRSDAASDTSHSSTRKLTALPIQHPSPDETRSGWLGSRTVCTAYQPGHLRSNSHDIERDADRI